MSLRDSHSWDTAKPRKPPRVAWVHHKSRHGLYTVGSEGCGFYRGLNDGRAKGSLCVC